MNNNIELKSIAKKIKLVALDVDGVMTNNTLIFDENGVEYKVFNGKDGQGIELLLRAGIIPAIISKRNNGTLVHRAKVLGIAELHMGQRHKIEVMNELLEKYGLSHEEAAFMGDDLPDICVLEKVGLPCCPLDAVDEVKAVSKFISTRNGGEGAVRELCELILKSQSFDLRELLERPVKIKCGT
ncbi:MAG: HAD hydrolase family protein [Candidatus Gastranaerophilales bacterium]|nr:HAD hydrolase family protein [Candidatus Gastranaerophilales bacterium]